MNWNPVDYRIFETVTGSRLYGTSTPASDFDYRGVVVPPLDVLLDPFHGFEQKDSGFEEEDRCLYSLSKFMQLCADNNPNVNELLFATEPIFSTPAWELISDNYHLFVSKKCRYTYSGYAVSQAQAIKRHRQWFIDPPKFKPERKDFGLTDSPNISGEKVAALKNVGKELVNPAVWDELQREIEYRDKKQAWDNYCDWNKNRNPARKETEEKFGYDTKYASHVFRLIEEGRQLLLTGKIVFPLENAEELLAIKNGKYSYEEVMERVATLDKQFDEWYAVSTLPHTADWKRIENLYREALLFEIPGLEQFPEVLSCRIRKEQE